MTTSSSATASAAATSATTQERDDILEVLGHARYFLRFTANELTDAQASERTTVSELTIAGLIKHVTSVEKAWAGFVVEGKAAFGKDFTEMDESDWEARANDFRMAEGETLAGLLERYEEVAAETDELVRTVPDLNTAHPLPEAPWNEPGAAWTARRTFAHIAAETAQHAGHADIIRETLDGAKSMG